MEAAKAAAYEQVAAARATVAAVAALEQAPRPGLLDQIYRSRIAAVLNGAGSVTAVDAKAVSRVIIPGGAP